MATPNSSNDDFQEALKAFQLWRNITNGAYSNVLLFRLKEMLMGPKKDDHADKNRELAQMLLVDTVTVIAAQHECLPLGSIEDLMWLLDHDNNWIRFADNDDNAYLLAGVLLDFASRIADPTQEDKDVVKSICENWTGKAFPELKTTLTVAVSEFLFGENWTHLVGVDMPSPVLGDYDLILSTRPHFVFKESPAVIVVDNGPGLPDTLD